LSELIKLTLYGDFVVVVDYPDKPASSPFILGWRGTSYFETMEQMDEVIDLMQRNAVKDMEERRTKEGYYYRVVDFKFRKEIKKG